MATTIVGTTAAAATVGDAARDVAVAWMGDGFNGSAEYNVTDDKLFDGYPPGLLTFASVTCLGYMLVGVPGNLITIIALARCKKVRNATAVFIINLSLSDLLFCCFNLPLATSTYWFSAWTHGDLLCRLFPLLRYGLSAVSLFTVLAITLNRYVMIGHPRVYPKIYRHRYLGVMVAGTWICAFSALIPTWRGTWGRFGLDRTIGSCSILPDENNTSPKDFFFVMAFVVPCVAIVVCYARIFYIVRKTAMRSHEPVQQQKSLTASTMVIPMQGSVRIKLDGSQTHIDNAIMTFTDAGCTALPNHSDAAHRTNAANNVTRPNCEPIRPQHSSLLAHGTKKHQRLFEPESSNSIEHSSEHSASTTTATSHGSAVRSAMKYMESGGGSSGLDMLSVATREQPSKSSSSASIGKSVEFRSDVIGGGSDDADDAAAVVVRVEDFGIDGEDEQEMSATSTDAHQVRRVTSVRRKRFRQNGQKVPEVDSAVEESTSSSENNQIYHIRSESNCNAELAVQVEPSSSSGIDMPTDDKASPPRRLRRSLAASLRRIKRTRTTTSATAADNDPNAVENTLGRINSRKHSTIHTSGASILYPGRMSAKDRRLLKMILVILSAFVACYLPITASKIIRPIQQISYLNIMGYLLIYLTTCINPIIYVVMSSEYRQAYWNLLMCRRTNGARRPTNKTNKAHKARADPKDQAAADGQRLVAALQT